MTRNDGNSSVRVVSRRKLGMVAGVVGLLALVGLWLDMAQSNSPNANSDVFKRSRPMDRYGGSEPTKQQQDLRSHLASALLKADRQAWLNVTGGTGELGPDGFGDVLAQLGHVYFIEMAERIEAARQHVTVSTPQLDAMESQTHHWLRFRFDVERYGIASQVFALFDQDCSHSITLEEMSLRIQQCTAKPFTCLGQASCESACMSNDCALSSSKMTKVLVGVSQIYLDFTEHIIVGEYNRVGEGMGPQLMQAKGADRASFIQALSEPTPPPPDQLKEALQQNGADVLTKELLQFVNAALDASKASDDGLTFGGIMNLFATVWPSKDSLVERWVRLMRGFSKAGDALVQGDSRVFYQFSDPAVVAATVAMMMGSPTNVTDMTDFERSSGAVFANLYEGPPAIDETSSIPLEKQYDMYSEGFVRDLGESVMCLLKFDENCNILEDSVPPEDIAVIKAVVEALAAPEPKFEDIVGAAFDYLIHWEPNGRTVLTEELLSKVLDVFGDALFNTVVSAVDTLQTFIREAKLVDRGVEVWFSSHPTPKVSDMTSWGADMLRSPTHDHD